MVPGVRSWTSPIFRPCRWRAASCRSSLLIMRLIAWDLVAGLRTAAGETPTLNEAGKLGEIWLADSRKAGLILDTRTDPAGCRETPARLTHAPSAKTTATAASRLRHLATRGDGWGRAGLGTARRRAGS